MLRDEHGMAAPGGLASVVGGRSGREAPGHEIARVRLDDLCTLRREIGTLGGAKAEAAAKRRALQRRENVVERSHAVRD